jgi:nitric oxide reductase large subunit
MNLTLKLVAFIFISVLGFCVFLFVGSIVGKQLPFSEPGEFNWWAIQSGSAGLFVAGVFVGPFLVILFSQRRWLAELLVTAPVLFCKWCRHFIR